jgi:hypothetical protein
MSGIVQLCMYVVLPIVQVVVAGPVAPKLRNADSRSISLGVSIQVVDPMVRLVTAGNQPGCPAAVALRLNRRDDLD